MIVVLGAGIAGLSAAEGLRGKTPLPIKVLERDLVPGGASRTVHFGEFRYDLGGHRFYTKKAHVQEFVERLLGQDLLTVDRVSHIAFNGRLVSYPLSAVDALSAMGPWRACLAGGDYLATRVREAVRPSPGKTFEEWTVSRFGRRLYDTYFKGYSEKIWGIPCDTLSADFAEQRIKGLSLREMVRDALTRRSRSTTLVRHFLYPRLGFGMLTDRMAENLEAPDEVLCGMPAGRICHQAGKILAVESRGVRFPVSHCVSSIAMDDMVRLMDPAPPSAVVQAAQALRYRDLVVLFLTFEREQITDDHWIYFPDTDCPFARFHEPKNWSPAMAPDGKTGLVVEFFCQEGDALWTAPAEDLRRAALEYIEHLGMAKADEAGPCDIQRITKAYPVYEVGYRPHVDVVLDYLSQFENLQCVGRNALFRYTSSDHYIDMGLRAADNILGARHDVVRIGTEAGYAEDGRFQAPAT